MNAAPTPVVVPSGIDLVTPDLGTAREFYTDLFGWTYDADGSTAHADGVPAAGLRAGAGPARWWTRFTTDDARAARAAATRAGARVEGDEVHDPLGGAFRLDAGDTVVAPGPGRPAWYEYMTSAPADADRFLADALALHATVPPGAPDDSYALLVAGGRPVAGRLALPPPLAGVLPTGWMVYVAVADPDEVAGRAGSRGGRVVVPPNDVPTGRVAALADPAGAVFTVIRPAAA
ncbi:VOC family protein [Micromonospora sp. NPDC049497]|uniref:VOC family protein n=1 Tax=Micromonospora sp. NPDC049497 TaxID=3364273 RepID=UPI0037A41F1B